MGGYLKLDKKLLNYLKSIQLSDVDILKVLTISIESLDNNSSINISEIKYLFSENIVDYLILKNVFIKSEDSLILNKNIIDFSIVLSGSERNKKYRDKKDTSKQCDEKTSQSYEKTSQNDEISSQAKKEKKIAPKKEKKQKEIITLNSNESVEKIYSFYRSFLIQKSRTTPKTKPFIEKLLKTHTEGEILNAVMIYMEEHKKALSEGKDFVKGGERFFNGMILDYIEKGIELQVQEVDNETKELLKINEAFAKNVTLELFLKKQAEKKGSDLTLLEESFLEKVYERIIDVIKQKEPKTLEVIYNESIPWVKESDPFLWRSYE